MTSRRPSTPASCSTSTSTARSRAASTRICALAQEDLKGNFFLVKLLEDNGYAGPSTSTRTPIAPATPTTCGTSPSGCMRTYLILKEKAQRFNEDKEIQAIVQELNGGGASPFAGGYSKEIAQQLKAHNFDVAALTNRPLPYEKLDQLVIDLLLGVR